MTVEARTQTPPVLVLEHISKVFGGTIALHGVSLAMRAGEVHALVGENGAGKSTLTRIMCGVHAPSKGQVLIDGATVTLASPAQAQANGIWIMHQEPSLFPHLDVAENVFCGRQPLRAGTPMIDRRAMREKASRVLATLDPSISPTALVRDLSVAQAQLVELASLLIEEPRILILDEPTASLTPAEVERMLDVVRRLRSEGVAILYISHRLSEVFALADQVTVLRDGAVVSHGAIGDYTETSLIANMVGRELLGENHTRTTDSIRDEVALSVDRLGIAGGDRPISFEVRRGEIVGLAGLIGAGRTELARAIVGLDARRGGEVRVDGKPVHSLQDALSAGLVYTPESRQVEGVALQRPIAENISLPQLPALSRGGLISRAAETTLARRWIERLRVKCQGPEQNPGQLSGGNQQKVVLAKWLATEPKVVIFDEPTRGVDVGAKVEIHQLIEGLARDGMAVILISSDLPEVMSMSDRILVMRGRAVTGEFTREEATAERIMTAAITELAA